MTQLHHQDPPWYQYESKIREIHQKDALDLEKISAEFSRLIVSNLFILNAGGLGSIPAISLFFDANSLTVALRVSRFAQPFVSFGLGAIFALTSAFVAYLNYQAGAEAARTTLRQELANIRKWRHTISIRTSQRLLKMKLNLRRIVQ